MKEVLLSIKEKYLQEGESAVEEDNDWYIYEPDDILFLSTPCYIAPRPEFDEDEEEIFPEYAIENNMDYSIMPPRFRRCCVFAKAVFLIQWGCFAAFGVCSMVLFTRGG